MLECSIAGITLSRLVLKRRGLKQRYPIQRRPRAQRTFEPFAAELASTLGSWPASEDPVSQYELRAIERPVMKDPWSHRGGDF